MRYTQSDRVVAHPLPSGRSLPALLGHSIALAIPQPATKHSGARNPVGIYIVRGCVRPSGKFAPHLKAVFVVGLPRTWYRIDACRTGNSCTRNNPGVQMLLLQNHPTGAPRTRYQPHRGVFPTCADADGCGWVARSEGLADCLRRRRIRNQ